MEALSLIAGAINEMPEANVYVVGHADDDPVRAGWIDNWDLSAARAHAVTRALTDELGVDPGRVISGGRANFYPVADNATEEGRAMNRRVVIHVEPNLDRLWAIPKKELALRGPPGGIARPAMSFPCGHLVTSMTPDHET
jgi:chemotaxis protein MotB